MSDNSAGKTVGQYNEAASQPSQTLQHVEVPAELDAARLDVAAARLFSDYSRARLRQWIESGRLLVDGARADKPRQPVHAGERLTLDPYSDPHPTGPVAQEIAFDVVYADRDLAIIDKPAGLVVHPGAGIADGTLLNGLLARFPQTVTVPRAGIVHRLDKNTSGLLVVALSLPAHARLVAALARREFHRQYDTIVIGQLVAGGTIDAPIGRDPRHRTRMAVTAGGRAAVTHFTVARRYARHTRLDVRLETGRTHQIRVHLTHLHHPLVGDSVYGARRLSGVAVADAFPRQALHACRLALSHPVTGREMDFRRDAPVDFQNLAAALEAGDG